MTDPSEAAVRGVTRAGFVRPRVRVDDSKYLGFGGRGFIELTVRADCPCGLGTSGFAIRLVDCPAESLGYVEEAFYRMAMDHIEHDKAEGRWTDA